MDNKKIKEDLSICYLNTIAAINGIALERVVHDEDSIDVIIKKLICDEYGNPKFNSQISIQLKSTSSVHHYSVSETDISYVLKAKNYNDLCTPASMPSILALLILPEDEEEWTSWSPEELMIKGKMFWLSLAGRIPSKNNTSVTVKIPKENVLNNVTILEIMKQSIKE